MSFTLNNKKYTSYMFEQNSDLETLILKVNAGDNAGIKEYTIDAIKYIDGTDIKDVLLEGDKTVKLGVFTTGLVSASVANQKASLNSVSFDASILNDYSLVADGMLKALLYDGTSILSKPLVVGNNSVEFDALKPNTLYQYAIAAKFDDLTGGGENVNILYKKALYTNAIALFDNIEKTKTSLTFDILWDSSITDKSLMTLTIALDSANPQELSPTTRTISGLLSNRTYTVTAKFNHKDKIDEISYTFTTIANITPIIIVYSLESTSDSITFSSTILDPDSLGAVSKIELYDGTKLEESLSDLNLATFSNLTSDTLYTLKITYTYNDADGSGEKVIVETKDIYTKLLYNLISTRCINTGAVFSGDKIVIQSDVNNPSMVKAVKVKVAGIIYNVSGASTENEVIVEILNDSQFAGGLTILSIESIFVNVRNTLQEIVIIQNNTVSCFINGEIEVKNMDIVNANGDIIDYALAGEEIYALIELYNPTGYNVDAVSFSKKPNATNITEIDNNHIKVRLDTDEFGDEYLLTSITYSSKTVVSTVKNIIPLQSQLSILNSRNFKEVRTVEDLKNMQSIGGDGYATPYPMGYRLMNNIDLAGVDWDIPPKFIGYLDGNGKTISNITVVKTFNNTNLSLGLFSSATGLIKNLTIANTLIIANVNITVTDKNYLLNYGGVACVSGNLILDNVHTSGKVSLTESSNNWTSAGGLINEANGITTIINCTNSTNITAGGRIGGLIAKTGYSHPIKIVSSGNHGNIIGQYSYIGGLVGYNSTALNIAKSYNSGNVTTGNDSVNCSDVGGFVGSNNSQAIIADSYNSGNIGGGYNVGGFMGNGSNSTIFNCYNSGNISGSYSVGGFIGVVSRCQISNSFSTGAITTTNYVGNALIGDFNKVDFEKIKIISCYYINQTDVFGEKKKDLAEIILAIKEEWSDLNWSFTTDALPTLR